jgi:hypothetical protein
MSPQSGRFDSTTVWLFLKWPVTSGNFEVNFERFGGFPYQTSSAAPDCG